MRMWRFVPLVAVLITLPAAAADLIRGETGQVGAVIDGDTVVLRSPIANAREIRLVGIQAPKLPLGRSNFKAWPLADKAKTALEELVRGRLVTLSYGGRRVDRHGRLLAHLHRDDGVWIQGEMLKRGLARVYTFADNRAIIPELLAQERAARKTRRGIWRHPYYQIRDQAQAERHLHRFELVEGKVLDVAVVRGRAYLNFGDNWRTDFTVTIQPKSLRSFKREQVDIAKLKGQRIRVRGWLRSFNGPMIEATHPEQIEVLE